MTFPSRGPNFFSMKWDIADNGICEGRQFIKYAKYK